MEFRILGPLEVTSGAQGAEITGQQRRLLLAAFLLHPNRPLTIRQLRNWLWPDTPAKDAHSTIHAAVSKLRRSLQQAAPATPHQLRTARSQVHRQETSYLLAVDPHQLDSLRFTRLVAEARASLAAESGRRGEGLERAASRLREALGLWRGEQVLEDLHLPHPLRQEADRLQRLRLDALEARIEADLELDRHGDVLPELEALAAAHPDHERFHALLMLARYRCGRQVAALGTYQHAYRILADRYGIQPSHELAGLQQRILARDPSLDSPLQAARRAGRPHDLPPAPPQLVGREPHHQHLQTLLMAPAGATVVVHGRAGVGKTALALHAAHQLQPQFPHGILYADLHGAGQPAAPTALLERFLLALGMEAGQIPDGLDARAGAFRRLLTDRRVLVVLDDAAGEAQIRPLLPGSATCVVLITSRAPLHTLPATSRLRLTPLEAEDAVALLAEAIDPGRGLARVRAEPTAARLVVEWCGRLPLAVRIAGGKLAARPSWSLETLAARLADRGLDELRLGDLDLRAVLVSAQAPLNAWQRQTLQALASLDAGDGAGAQRGAVGGGGAA